MGVYDAIGANGARGVGAAAQSTAAAGDAANFTACVRGDGKTGSGAFANCGTGRADAAARIGTGGNSVASITVTATPTPATSTDEQ